MVVSGNVVAPCVGQEIPDGRPVVIAQRPLNLGGGHVVVLGQQELAQQLVGFRRAVAGEEVLYRPIRVLDGRYRRAPHPPNVRGCLLRAGKSAGEHQAAADHSAEELLSDRFL